MSVKRLFLVDAYALIFRAYYAHVKHPRLDSKERNTSAIYGFATMLGELLGSVSPDYIGVVFDPPGGSFRHREYPEYKANRDATPEPIRFGVPYIKDIVRAYNIPIYEVEDYEADDVIGTLAKQGEQAGLEVFMVTPDKDFAQLVTPNITMYRPLNGGGYEEWGVAEVCERYGLSSPVQMIDFLGMVGDAADNLPGIPGVGEKTASKLLAKYGSLENALDHAHEEKGKLGERLATSRASALRTRHLATICTSVPIALDLPALERKQIDYSALLGIFDEFEFHQLAKRLRVQQATSANSIAPSDTTSITSPTEAEEPPTDLFASSFAVQGEETNSTSMPESSEITSEYNLTQPSIIVLHTAEEIASLASVIEQAERIALNLITDSSDPLRAELIGLALSLNDKEGYYIPMPRDTAERIQCLEGLQPYLVGSAVKVGHDLKFAIHILSRYGISLGGELFDTMVAHYLLQPDMSHHLIGLGSRYLGYQAMEYTALIDPYKPKEVDLRSLPIERLALYGVERATMCYGLYQTFSLRLQERELMGLMQTLEMPLLRVLVDMEQVGVRIDLKALAEQSKLLHSHQQSIADEIYRLAGRPININSPRQISELLFDELDLSPKPKKTKTGGYTTNEESLEKLRGAHPIVGRILDYRGLQKLLSTYIDALPQAMYEDGKVHTTFNQAVAATGRLSSTNPNLQNIPIRTPQGSAIRSVFVPDSDSCVFVSADYSQIELRLMAHFSGDPALIEAFSQGLDIHQATAAKIHHLPIEEVTPEMRRQAKTANFGIIYGISAFGLAERLGIGRSEAKTLIEGYFASYPGVELYMKRTIRQAQTDGYVTTLLGRRRYIPEIGSSNAVVRGNAERNAINAPLQGTAADIIKLAMIRIDEQMRARGMRSRMILQVHDELNFNAYPDELDELQTLIRSTMEGVLPELSVPLEVSIGTGRSWLDAH